MSKENMTAVEWLLDQMFNKKELKIISTHTFHISNELAEKAKAMEKEQMIEHSFNFYYDLSNKKGVPFNLISENRILAEEYYKDTYENSKD